MNVAFGVTRNVPAVLPSVLTEAVSVWNTSLTESFGFRPEAVAENPGSGSFAVIVALLAVIVTCPFVIVNT